MLSSKSYKWMIIIAVLFLLIFVCFRMTIKLKTPSVNEAFLESINRNQIGKQHYSIGDNWIQQNKTGIFECYLEGDGFERGVIHGALMEELMDQHERVFLESIQEMVPSNSYLSFLKYIVAWKNRNIQNHISPLQNEEIYGISFFLPDRYDNIGPKFYRKMYYHAAHDIGHTIQNMGLVGCSALAVTGDRSDDGDLLLGRNFDFYVGDEFADQKCVFFIKPKTGNPYASFSWPGMIGVLSGMNLKGITISLNAGPAAFPSDAKTPVALLAQQVMIEASTIKEAINIIKEANVFVSEIFMIGSAYENKSVVVEKTPDSFAVYNGDNSVVTSTNHFQSDELKDLETNTSFIKESSTVFRLNRMQKLLNQKNKISPKDIAEILRDDKGQKEEDIGFENEKCINTMRTHHSIIFKPKTLDFWVSQGESPLDSFLHYNLDSVFNNPRFLKSHSLSISSENIKASKDNSKINAYHNYKEELDDWEHAIDNNVALSEKDIAIFVKSNQDSYVPHMMAGKYLKEQGNCELAIPYFDAALERQIAWKRDYQELLELKDNCNN